MLVNFFSGADLQIPRSTTLAGGRPEQELWRRSQSEKYNKYKYNKKRKTKKLNSTNTKEKYRHIQK